VFNDDLNFRGKLWMKVKEDSCLVLRMTITPCFAAVTIKTSAEMTRWGRNGEEGKECKNSKLVCLNLNKFFYFIVKNNNIIME
jgi:hypothetical protein